MLELPLPVSSPRRVRLALLAGALALGVTSDPSHAQGVASGHRLYAPQSSTTTFLVDRQGTTVHSWPSNFQVGISAYLDANGALFRTIRTAFSGRGSGGGIQKHALDGTLLWDFRYDSGGVLSHHDIEPMPNGNVLLIAWEDKTPAEAIAAGRNPAFLFGTFMPDHIVEVMPTGPTTGTIVWEWHVWDHLIQDFDSSKANFGNVGAHPELIDLNYPPGAAAEFNHVNGVDYDPVHDWIVVSAHSQDEVWIIDHGTTTAEAAGHTGGNHGKGGDLLYRWGNPVAYRAGTLANQELFGQHSPKFIPAGSPGAGNLLIFNNDPPPASQVIEIVLPLDAQDQFVFGPGGVFGPAAPVWTYSAPGFNSGFMSSCERLPNGNTLICSTLQGRIFEVSAGGQNLWEVNLAPGFGAPFHATYYERSLWSDDHEVSVTAGGTVALDLIAGSEFGGDPYVILGSATGTSPGTPLGGGLVLPIQFDAYSILTYANANTATFPGFSGTLSATTGRATASVVIPANLPAALAGLVLDHAYVVLDPSSGAFLHASNAERVTLTP